MLRIEPLADVTDDRWRLVCDRCGNEYEHPVSGAAAHELDGTACFVCETDPAELERALAGARAWADLN